jgi:hypothetical protein
MSKRNRIIFYCFAWAAALIATSPSLELFSLVWMFPLGLAALIHPPWSQGGWPAIGVGTAIYVAHAILYFRAKRRGIVIILAIVLVVMLICNVSSCRAIYRSR